MLNKNMGTTDRIIRLVLGVVLISLVVVLDGPLRFVSLIALVPLITSFVSWCPVYAIFGLRTCPVRTASGS